MPKPKTRRGARPNGRILTAKNLSKRAYASIHSLPRGTRAAALHALIEAAASYAAQRGGNWYRDIIDGNLILTQGRRNKAGVAVTKSVSWDKPDRVSKALEAAKGPARDVGRGGAGVRAKAARASKREGVPAQRAKTAEDQGTEATEGAKITESAEGFVESIE